MDLFSLAAYDFPYPESQVAQQPLPERDASRLLVLPRFDGACAHRVMRDLPTLLQPGDLLLINTTRVLPARLCGARTGGGPVELLLLTELSAAPPRWRAIGFPMRKLVPGTAVHFPGESLTALTATIVERCDDEVIVEFSCDGPLLPHLEAIGAPPLPPYIHRSGPAEARRQDRERYQTIYAVQSGSAAVPTAGLHFSDALLAACRARGVQIEPVILHVGLDTFQPIRTEDLRTHRMHGEYFEIPDTTWNAVQATKSRGGRVIAVGTTTVRAVESAAQLGKLRGSTSLFITPGFPFQIIDGLLTNFHQPKSSLVVLVSAFATRQRILDAYQTAITENYRLFSYGDAMLIV